MVITGVVVEEEEEVQPQLLGKVADTHLPEESEIQKFSIFLNFFISSTGPNDSL